MPEFSPISNQQLDKILNFLDGRDSFVFLETTRVTAAERYSYLFWEPFARIQCRVDDDPEEFFKRLGEAVRGGGYLAGWFSYEFGYFLEPALRSGLESIDQPLAEFAVYGDPLVYDHQLGDFMGDFPGEEAQEDFEQTYRLENLRLSLDKTEYLRQVGRIKEYIEAGDTYQVNYTLKQLFDFKGSAGGLYRALRRNQSVSYGAFMRSGNRRVLSFSPELFFRKNGDSCLVRPMKGTSSRGRGLAEDRAVGEQLAADPKNRSENIMIVDLLRNDLGRLCEMGGVEVDSLFDIEQYETLLQMTSSITGSLRPGVSWSEIFRAIFPCGSVTGAPKIRTMEIIRELEGGLRGLYTGGVGMITPRGDAVFNVPIRTVCLDGCRGEMGIGSGIVYDSDPRQEWLECQLKGRFLTNPEAEFELLETMVWTHPVGVWWLDLHLARLADSAEYWGIAVDEPAIRRSLADKDYGKLTDVENSGVRIRLSVGKDGRFELGFTPCPAPSLLNGPAAVPERIILSGERVDSSNVFLYHKTTRRELYDRERRRAEQAGYFEVIFANERGEITEGSITSIFLKKAGQWFTPAQGSGLLPGVLRTRLLERGMPGQESSRLQEALLTRRDLEEAEALYVGNSVRGLIPAVLVTDD